MKKPNMKYRIFLPLILVLGSLLPPAVRADCTNCTTTETGGDIVHTFDSGSGTFTPPAGVTEVEYLIVGGGGGGGGVNGVFFSGSAGGGGGGAGGILTDTGFTVTPLTTYNIVVGAGGAGGNGATRGANGQNSSFASVIAIGGGGGGAASDGSGLSGGSGGGGHNGGAGGNGTSGQGNNGGSGGSTRGGGGGGSSGDGAAGGDGSGAGGVEGAGQASGITGSSVTYAAGGTGGAYGQGRSDGTAAASNTGNGGSGANGGAAFFDGAYTGGAGGSGLVVIRYTVPPLTYGSCDDFESGFGNWSASGSGDASIGTETSNSPNSSMRLRWNTVTATSIAIDMDQPLGFLEVWVRRGANSFSDRPEGNENLVLEYLNDSNSWVALETFSGGGPQGEIFDRSYPLPTDALHSDFRIRFRLLNGSGVDFDYWHVDDVCLIDPLTAAYHMDEPEWDGTPDEVEDSSSNGRHGTAVNGADTEAANPAIPGTPGTCSYGTFDGSNDYVQVNNLSDVLNGTASLAFWINTPQTGNDTGWQAPGVTGVEEAGGADDIFWGWLDATGRIGISVANDFTSKSTVTINDGSWHHVVLTRDASTGAYQIFIDGSLNTSGTIAAGIIGNSYSSIGRIEDTDGSHEYFNGELDEVRIYSEVLDATAVNRVMNLTRPCPIIGPDHYAIAHDGTGVTCQAEAVTITAHDAGHAALDPGAVTIALSTTTGRGDWSGVLAGSGVLNNGAAGDGAASYTFPGGEASVTLAFNYTDISSDSESFFFDVTDGAIGDLGNGLAEDPQMTFARTGFRFLNATEGNTIIPAQIAGKPSNVAPTARNLALQAIRTSDEDTSVCEAAFPSGEDRTIELAAECRNPATCAGNQVRVNGNAVTTNNDNAATGSGAYTPVILSFGANATAPLVLDYSDAGLMQLHARYNIPLEDGTLSGDYMLGSSNDFVVRPFGFHVDVASNPAATNANGNIFTAAGEDFDATVRAVVWQSSDDGNNDGIPDNHADNNPGNNTDLGNNPATPNFGQETTPQEAVLNPELFLPAAGNNGSLAGDSTLVSFTNGEAAATLSYSEVGIIEIRADNSDYLNGGQNITGVSGHVGRFIPYDFDVVPNTPAFASACSGAADDFTYIGQAFDYATEPVLTVTAKSKDKQNTTANYTGDFFKLTDAKLTSDGDKTYSAEAGTLDTNLINSPDPDIQDNGDGTATLTFNSGGGIAFVRDAPEAPFDAEISLSINVIDEDDVVYGDGDGNNENPAQFGEATAGNGIAFNDSKEQRWGRLRLVNASGSELLPLEIPVLAEYLNDSGVFVRNTDDDNCAGIVLGDFGYSGPLVGVSTPPAFDPIAGGTGGLTFPAPGEGNTGFVDVEALLDTAMLSYLQFDWDGDGGHDDNPAARASFGIYSGTPGLIYIREPW